MRRIMTLGVLALLMLAWYTPTETTRGEERCIAICGPFVHSYEESKDCNGYVDNQRCQCYPQVREGYRIVPESAEWQP